MPEEKLFHTAAVIAQLLDNNQDGKQDSAVITEVLKSNGATFLMTKTSAELDSINEQVRKTI